MKDLYLLGEEVNIIQSLKPGGQKSVYIINHKKYGVCVLKVGKCNSKTSLERIKREVDILNSIDSKYFPKNFEFKYLNDGKFMIIEEYIPSQPLSQMTDRFNNEKIVLELALNIIEGLHILWDRNIVHRDLKPDNILIKEDGNPVIIDLGIARVLDDKSLTNTLLLQGPCTPVYASPEQLKNQKNSIDARSDFFSLAIIITELIIGCHPYLPQLVGSGVGIVDNILSERYLLQNKNRVLSEPLQKIIRKLLKTEPFERIRTYKKLKEEIEGILNNM